MRGFYATAIYCLIFFLSLHIDSQAQSNTVGTIYNSNQAAEGYTLFCPIGGFQTYLIDNCGRQINSWESNYQPGMNYFLLNDGSLVRSARKNNPNISIGGLGGRMERYDWAGNLTWYYDCTDSTYTQHHDFEVLPNGNLLLLMVRVKSFNEMIAVARDSNLSPDTVFWTESIMEIQPTGINGANIVWEWHVWDHLVQDLDSTKANYGNPATHPERMNINYIGTSNSRDWLHANSIDYNPVLDQIVIGFRNTNEVWIIDHNTTTAEAAGTTGGQYGKGGDILYRWGQPAAYGASGPQIFYGQHDIQWIPDTVPGGGKLMCFNNGDVTGQSSVDVFTPPTDSAGFYTQPQLGMAYGPTDVEWRYTDTIDPVFFSSRLSGTQRLPNGNTLVCSGANGYFVEVDSAKNRVWVYRNPATSTGIASQGTTAAFGTNSIFQCIRYSPGFPGFVGKDMTPGDPIETNFNLNQCIVTGLSEKETQDASIRIYPNPATDILFIESEIPVYAYHLSDINGKLLRYKQIPFIQNLQIDFAELPAGIYFLRINQTQTEVLIKK